MHCDAHALVLWYYIWQENIHFALSDMGTDISSTKVRLAVRRGRSVRLLVHPDVVDYMADKGLYAP